MRFRGSGATGAVIAGLRGIAADSVAGVDRTLNEDRIRLAVTGLSRAGKTVFITSLIHNLLALGKGRDTLPALTRRLTQNGATRLRRVEVSPAGAGVLPFFDYASKLDQLASATPAWPPRTDDLAQISLALEIERSSALGRRLGSRRVRLDILDYPGEWLLDLPMLGQSFAAWSTQTHAMLRTSPRLECSGAFLAFAEGLRGSDRAEESLLHRGHTLYRAALAACRDKHELRYLQPGRFVCPGPGSEAPFMWFFPLVVDPGAPRPGSTAELLEERFTAYQQHVRTTFFDTHFASFDRQIMLVDVLGALFTGRAAFEDTARVIHDLAVGLLYGGNTVARALFAGQRRIEKVVFVATKADHVPAMRRDNLRHLLRALADAGTGRQLHHSGGVSHRVAAAILSTRDGTLKTDDRVLEVVQGILMGEDKIRSYFVGDVPASLPPESFWSERFLQLPVFRPPPIEPNGAIGIPHLNLDQVLDDVIGDLL